MFAYPTHDAVVLSERWRQRALVLIALFFGLVVVAPWVIWLPALLIGGVVMIGARVDVAELATVTAPSRAFAAVSLAAFVSALLPYVPNDVSWQGIGQICQFTVLPLAAILFASRRRSREVPWALWAGCSLGALLSGLSAVVQVIVLDVPRAEGPTRNAVVFGDLALLMGAVALALGPVVAAGCSDSARSRLRLVSITAAGCGVVASVLSGSRGSWIAAPAIVLLLLWQLRSVNRRAATAWVLAAIAGVAFVVISAGGMPLRRATDAIDNVIGYVGAAPTDPAAGTTIGARFEAWKAAVDAFVNEPVLGVGWGNLDEWFDREVIAGARNPRIATFDHAHQEVLGTLASSGIVGCVAWFAVLAVPALYFLRAARSRSQVTRWTSTAGLVTVVSFFMFGLTESIFHSFIALAVYAMVVAGLLSQLDGDRVDDNGLAERSDDLTYDHV